MLGNMTFDFFFNYICPSLGVIMSTLMYAAPVNDLKQALLEGRIGSLNPVPWAVMTGNCLGWIAYSYYTRDPFILASNIPGILVSVWLNLGAAKLQYYERRDGNRRLNETAEEEDSPSLSDKGSVLAPQELLLLRILALWLLILVSVGWLGIKNANQAAIIGILVNINLLFFYASPLQTVMTVIAEKSSESIHRNTMIMNWVNTSFWVLYGFVARNDPVIYGPNAIGLFFGLLQGLLCCIYPERREPEVDTQPLLEEESGPIENEDESTRNVSEVV